MTRASDTAKLLGAGATILDGTTISTADNTAQLTLTSTDADSNFGPLLTMYRNSSSPADADFLGDIEFQGENSAGETITYAQVFGRTVDVTDGTEDGRIAIKTIRAGASRSALDISATEIVLNDDSEDVDFRVESNGNANMLFVDGGTDRVGIGTNSPQKLLHLKDGDIVVGNGTASNNAVIGRIGFSTDSSNSRFIGMESFRGGDAANGDLRFHTFGGDSDSGERVRIHTNGVLSASDGIALGVGTANTASNVLDDYEEGTWTAGFQGATVSISATTGYYTKIGRKVFFNYYADTMSISNASGGAVINGLPFTASNASQNYGLFTYVHGTAVSNSKGGFISKGTTYMTFITDNSTDAATYVNGTKYAMVSGFYFTDS